MNNLNRIIGVVLFLSLYISAITSFHVPNSTTTQTSQNSFQKKQVQISIVSNESVSAGIDIVSDNFQNNFPSSLKKYSDNHDLYENAIVSQEKSKFKQYSAIWHNQLIVSRKTDQLYPHHTFG